MVKYPSFSISDSVKPCILERCVPNAMISKVKKESSFNFSSNGE
jgi:hypothetical protein